MWVAAWRWAPGSWVRVSSLSRSLICRHFGVVAISLRSCDEKVRVHTRATTEVCLSVVRAFFVFLRSEACLIAEQC